MKTLLLKFLSFFNFPARWREEREAERAHQLRLAQTLVSGLESLMEAQTSANAETTKAVLALAEASAKNSEAFASWIKSFQTQDPPTTSVVREEDEYAAELRRFAEENNLPPEELIGNLPEEFRMAYELRQGFEDDVRNSN